MPTAYLLSLPFDLLRRCVLFHILSNGPVSQPLSLREKFKAGVEEVRICQLEALTGAVQALFIPSPLITKTKLAILILSACVPWPQPQPINTSLTLTPVPLPVCMRTRTPHPQRPPLNFPHPHPNHAKPTARSRG